MIRTEFGDRIYFQSDILNDISGITHCFTTKCGGVSSGLIKGLNLGFRVGDDETSVIENYRLIAKDFGFSYEQITAGRQTHSANIKIITKDDAGKGVGKKSDFMDVDGLVTNVRDLPIVVYYADCVPLLLVDEHAGVIAAVHSGWRGTVMRIASEAVRVMCESFDAEPKRIKAAIGPSIGPCCFETGSEVACEFDDKFVTAKNNGKFMVDLWSANKDILSECGLRHENIDVLGLCTICHSDVLYSYRTHKEKTGRMGAFISLGW